MANEEDKLEALKCTKCGGNLSKSYRIEKDDDDVEEIPIAKCLSCGAEYDQHTDEYYKFFANDFLEGKDNSLFKLGLKGTLNGKEYEIIARIRYQEEDEYEIETWDEWLAIDSEGSYHYFVEEEGEFHSFEEYTPQSINIESDPIEFEGKRISKDDGFVARVVYFEGELPYKPEIGEAITLYDFKKDGIKYSIEQSEDEVSITRGDQISNREIIEAFGTEEHKKLFVTNTVKRKELSKVSWFYLAATIISFVMGAYNCSVDKPIKNVMVNKQHLVDNTPKFEQGKYFYLNQVLYGPVIIPKKNQLYSITLSINTAVQRFSLEWQSIRMMLIKKERLEKALGSQFDSQALRTVFAGINTSKEPIESYIINADFWDERGRDSEGTWHESDTRSSVDFVLDESGSYYLYIESYSQKKRVIESVRVAINQTASSRYYFIVMFIFLAFFLYYRTKSKNYNALPFDVA